MTDLDWKLCNCAGCGRLLISPSQEDAWRKLPADQREKTPLVAGRILDRPYCPQCLAVLTAWMGSADRMDDEYPWQQNSIRQAEDQ